MRPIHKVKNKTTDYRGSLRKLIVMLLAFIGFVFLMFYLEKTRPELEEYFIKYDDATLLVEIEYGELTLVGYKRALGFMNNDIYEKYKNNECDEATITVYHPYLRGESMMVDTDSVVTITIKTYENFYKAHSPETYVD